MLLQPAWAPDGKTIAFLRRLPGGRQAIYIVPAQGGEERKIGEILTMVAGICWTPDSRHLIVPDSPKSVPLALFLLSINSGQRRKLTDYISAFHPALSPDGRTLAFIQERDGPSVLYFLPLNKNFLPEGPPASSRASIHQMRHVKWARDGQSLVFSVAHHRNRQAYRYWFSSEKIEPLVSLGQGIRTIEELPNGQGVLVTRGLEHRSIVKVPLPPVSKAVSSSILSFSDDSDPAVSPDGQLLAFTSMRDGSETLLVSKIDGSNRRSISFKDAAISRIRWSPDSKTIVLTASRGERPEIYRVSVESGKAEKLLLDRANNRDASFSRDGRWMYFISDISGIPQIWKVPAAGGSPVLVTSAPADYMEESVDGESLLYYWRSTLYRLSLRDHRISRIAEHLPSNLFRPAKNGFFYVAFDIENGLYQLNFQSFSGGAPISVLPPTRGLLDGSGVPEFSVFPDESALVAEVRSLETNLEVLPE